MKQCLRCHRLLSTTVKRCLYCRHTGLHEPVFAPTDHNANYRIYSHEIVVDNQAYRIVESLGRGAFGRVLKVLHPTEKKYYALKVPLIFDQVFSNRRGHSQAELDKSLEYLQREIEMLPGVNDECFIYRYRRGMVQTFLLGEEVCFPVLLMEPAETTLESLIGFESSGAGRLAEEEKAKIIIELVNALIRLHSLGVVHRDLSPDNLFVAQRGDKIVYVLGDFGAAKSLSATQSGGGTSEIVGHGGYLDPAAYSRKYREDLRLDIYSLGVIITEVLIGNTWFDVIGRENIPDLLALDFEKEFLLEYAVQYVRRDIIEVLRRAVTRDMAERYQSVEEFRQALFAVFDTDLSTAPTHPQAPISFHGVRARQLHIPFYFTLKLPFKMPDDTFSQEIITYKEGKKIELRDYRGAKLVFPDFYPARVRVKRTGLYSAAPAGNAVLLNFLNGKFFQLEKTIAEIKKDVRGELYFMGVLEVEEA